MNPLLECCEQNLAKGLEQEINDSQLDQQVDVVTYSCMNYCDICAQSYYGLFEGEIIQSTSTTEFVAQVRKKVAEWKIEME